MNWPYGLDMWHEIGVQLSIVLVLFLSFLPGVPPPVITLNLLPPEQEITGFTILGPADRLVRVAPP